MAKEHVVFLKACNVALKKIFKIGHGNKHLIALELQPSDPCFVLSEQLNFQMI